MQHQFVHNFPKSFKANGEHSLLMIVNLKITVLNFHHVRRRLLQAVQLAGEKLPAARIFEIPEHPQLSSRLAGRNACKQGRLGVGTNKLEASCTRPGRLGLHTEKGTISGSIFFSLQYYRKR